MRTFTLWQKDDFFTIKELVRDSKCTTLFQHKSTADSAGSVSPTPNLVRCFIPTLFLLLVGLPMDDRNVQLGFNGLHNQLVVRVQVVVKLEEVKLRVVGLFGLDDDLHLWSLVGDEEGRLLDDDVDFECLWLKGETRNRVRVSPVCFPMASL